MDLRTNITSRLGLCRITGRLKRVSLVFSHNPLLDADSRLGDVGRLDAHTHHLVNVSECQQPSMAGPSTVNLPVLPPSLPPATPAGPTAIPYPPAAPYWGCKCLLRLRSRFECLPARLDSPLPTTSSIAAGSHRSGMYDQLQSAPNSSDQWPRPISVGKGKARATEYVPLTIRPAADDNTSE